MAKKKAKAEKPTFEPALDSQCTALLRRCRNCDYSFRATDKRRKCPECKADRRCTNTRHEPHTVCETHLRSETTQPDKAKFFIARHLESAYNRIVGSPDLLRISQELALLASRTDQLFRMMDANDPSVAHRHIIRAANVIEQGVFDKNVKGEMDVKSILTGIDMMRRAMEPVKLNWLLWAEIKENFELSRRMSDTERHYIVMDQQAIPTAQVIEALVFVQRLALKYIATPRDRAAFARELREALTPSGPEPAMIVQGQVKTAA